MSEIVKPFSGDLYGEINEKLDYLASYANNEELKAVAFAVIRADGRIEMAAFVDDADRSKLRGAVLEIAAALAES